MDNLKMICDGVYEDSNNSRSSVIVFEGKNLYRFMDVFYIECAADELTFAQVESLCRARALNPRSFGGVNLEVRKIFKKFIENRGAANVLEVGAGTNPIISDADLGGMQINYIKSDADPVNAEPLNVFSGVSSVLNYPDGRFDIIAAVFVLHFNFPSQQISEVFRCLKSTGVFMANVYRRTNKSRLTLKNEFESCGFVLHILDDPGNLCQDHQYWIAGKNGTEVQAAVNSLQELLSL